MKGLQARLQYQRIKFERFLRVKANSNINLVDKIPLELKTSRLPLSYHFYDSVPIMIARYLAQLDLDNEEEEEIKERELIEFQ